MLLGMHSSITYFSLDLSETFRFCSMKNFRKSSKYFQGLFSMKACAYAPARSEAKCVSLWGEGKKKTDREFVGKKLGSRWCFFFCLEKN